MEAHEAQIQDKIEKRQDRIEEKVGELEGHLRDIQLNCPATSKNALKVITPSLDGTLPFKFFKLQIKKIAAKNNWSMED